MSKVLIGGSRKISSLGAEVKGRLDDLLSEGHDVLVGDANGADKAVQTYFAKKEYLNVTVFCSGDDCRNNVGNWAERHIQTSSRYKDFNHYSEKDKVMAGEADQGLFLWDGESRGTLENIRRLINQGKSSTVYSARDQAVSTVESDEDLQSLISAQKSRSPLTKSGPRRARKAATQPLF